MDIRSFFKNNWIHFAILAVFVIITVAYFSPEFDGYSLKQHDVEQHKGMSNEIVHHREVAGEEPLWTNSMFGGMPAIQVSTLYKGNIFQTIIIWFLGAVGVPAAIFLLHLIGFYIMSLCLRLKPLIGMFGSLAYALASYEIVILQAGHNSKATAMAFMAPVLGAFIMAYRRNWKWGVILSAFFMTWELAANHLQVTYYLGILLLAIGVYELIEAIRTQKIKQFVITSAGIIGGYLIALLINYGNITLTNDYAKYSIRGANDLTINPDNTPIEKAQATTGLDKDYITNWSYGKGESFTLLSPYVKGSHSAPLAATRFADVADKVDLTREERKGALDMPLYWGDQPMTSGPVYLGVLSVFLALLGLFFLKDRIKWVFFAVSVLALMLSWGKNFMGLTDFFIDYIPGYNKFRTVTIILILIELCVPLLAVLTLQKLYDKREEIKSEKKLFLYVSGGFLVFLLLLTFTGLGDNYTSASDQNLIERYRSSMYQQINGMDPAVLAQQYGVDVKNKQQLDQFVDAQMANVESGMQGIKKVRKQVYRNSMLRSFGFGLLGIIIIALFFYTAVPAGVLVGAASFVLLLDLVVVDRNYLGTETQNNGNYVHWIPEGEAMYPISASAADEAILQNEISQNPTLKEAVDKGEKEGKAKAEELGYSGSDRRRVIDSYRFSALNRNTDYRVFDYNGGWNSARASYFHKSLGGYHGAKLRSIQNLFEFQIAKTNNKVMDMMNVKYFIQGDNIRPNPTAMGNAWLVKSVKEEGSNNDLILDLGSKFRIVNVGQGRMLINGEAQKDVEVYGIEDMKYLVGQGDTLSIPVSNGLSKGMKAYFVSDVNGKTNLVPEMTVQMDTSNSFNKLVSIELLDRFDPAQTALVLKGEFKFSGDYSGEGSVKLKSYAPNKLVYEADLKGKQLIVFSEVYYPVGWTASVDGKQTEINRVDYILRGLEVDGGKHEIVFSYDLPKLHTSNMMAVVGSIILFIAIAFGIWKIPMKAEDK